jgi:hypothetical protein
MPWLVFTGVVLFIAGFSAPLFGSILGRDFGRASLALCIVGMAALVARAILYKPRGVRRASIDSDGNFSDTSDLGGHDGHDGGHGGDGGDAGH